MTTATDIGSLLVRTRRAQGISQRELGARTGVHQQQIARWESTDYRTANLERVVAVAEALGLGLAVAPTQPLGTTPPLVAEAPAPYGLSAAPSVAPVRDLGEIAARIRENGPTFRDRYHLDRIGVFGSFVYGEQTADSDVDLLVETHDPGGFRFIEAADFAQEVLGRHVDFVRPHLLKERLAGRVLKEALYVWSA